MNFVEVGCDIEWKGIKGGGLMIHTLESKGFSSSFS